MTPDNDALEVAFNELRDAITKRLITESAWAEAFMELRMLEAKPSVDPEARKKAREKLNRLDEDRMDDERMRILKLRKWRMLLWGL